MTSKTISQEQVEAALREASEELIQFLMEKNRSYGNSAIEPVRIFSQASPLEQINVRIDDKLSRMIHGSSFPGDNDEQDLMGYFMLKKACQILTKNRASFNLAQEIAEGSTPSIVDTANVLTGRCNSSPFAGDGASPMTHFLDEER